MKDMLPLRTKIILSLIGMSFLAIAVGGATARVLMLERFDEVVIRRASEGLIREVRLYYQAYGSWDAAAEVELFQQFARRTVPPGLAPRSGDAPEGRTPGRPPDGPPPNFDFGTPPPPGSPRSFHGAPAPPFIVTDADGVLRVGTPNAKIGSVLSPRELRDAIPIDLDGERIGYALEGQRLILTDVEKHYFQSLVNALWISILLVAAISIPVGVLLGRRLVKPINTLSHAVRDMQPGQIRQEVPVTSTDEIGQLSQSFNVMSSEMASFVEIIEEQKAKIVETEALRKEGMASISHELRTPLNNCVAQAEAMSDGIRPMNAEQMNVLSSSLDHLTKLVDDLFQLALSDVNALECAEERIDFAAIACEAVVARQSDFETNGIQVIQDIPEQMEVVGDGKRLRQIIDNLLENCFRYAKDASQIKVLLKQEAEFAELTVSDNGPGVPVDALESIFDRFYRQDASRDRNTGGTGLGLSLVRAWAKAQGGSTRALLTDDGGLGIKVYIPLSKSELRESARAYA